MSVLKLDWHRTKVLNALPQMEKKEILQPFLGLFTAKGDLRCLTTIAQEVSRMQWAFLLTRTILFYLVRLCCPR